jgi:hypothetical protein
LVARSSSRVQSFWAPEPSATIVTLAAATPAGRQKGPIPLGFLRPIISNVSSDTAAQHRGVRASGLPIRQNYSPSDLRTRAARKKPSPLYLPALCSWERSAGSLAQLVLERIDLPFDLLIGRALWRDKHTPTGTEFDPLQGNSDRGLGISRTSPVQSRRMVTAMRSRTMEKRVAVPLDGRDRSSLQPEVPRSTRLKVVAKLPKLPKLPIRSISAQPQRHRIG